MTLCEESKNTTQGPLHYVLSNDGEVLHMRSIKHLEALVIYY